MSHYPDGMISSPTGLLLVIKARIALMIIAADIVAIWGLCAYGSRQNIEAAA